MAKRTQQSPGCLLQLACYLVLLVPGYFASLPSAVTGPFEDRDARLFMLAVVSHETADATTTYSAMSLAEYRDGALSTDTSGILLPDDDITINDGDSHHVQVIERHADWQLIEFSYSNTHTSVSRYRAFPDRVEPVYYQMTSSDG